MKDESKFEIGDMVFSPHFGEGIITEIDEKASPVYPIVVDWKKELQPYHRHRDVYTIEGLYAVSYHDPGFDISKVKKDAETTTFGVWLNRARDYVLMQLEKRRANSKEKEIEEMKDGTKFEVGDKVISKAFGVGTVSDIVSPDHDYTVTVKWDEDSVTNRTFSYFTSRGHFYRNRSDTEKDIELLERGEKKVEDNTEEGLKVGDCVWLNPNEKGIITFICPDKDTCIVDSELDGEVEAVMAGLTKVEYSPINPSHYQVAGIPEAIEIMEHLMNKEQLEGFLWGNILKYAYRYGRKGDKKETAGKIEWYAKKLKEVVGNATV